MSDSDKLEMLSVMCDETDETILSTYLELAAGVVIQRAYPYDTSITTVPSQYDLVQLEIATYMINKRGAEGESAHSENGVSRTYEDGDIPITLLRRITPVSAPVTSTTSSTSSLLSSLTNAEEVYY